MSQNAKQNKFLKIFYVILILGMLAFVIDVRKPPEKQLSVKLTVQTIHIYQQDISPILRGKVKCVYQISCSHYAIMAMEKYGFVKGSYLTIGRISSCRQSIGPREEWENP